MVVLSREEGRGVDTRFRKDAIVLITSEVGNYHELLQMIGRSSRTRGVCEGILYVVTQEKQGQVIERLKRSSVSALIDLERLIKIVEKRFKDSSMIKLLTDAKVNGHSVRSPGDVKALISEVAYSKLIKGVFE